MKAWKSLMASVLCAGLLAALPACGSNPGQVSAPPSTSTPADTQPAQSGSAGASEEEAWKQEPAYGTTIIYEFDGGNCTIATRFAELLGYYEEAGIDVKFLSGNSPVDVIATNKAQFTISHLSHLLVPATNGADIVFTTGAHTGCKSLYVLTDSGYDSTADLVGTTVSAPEGMGSSDYNMLVRFFDKDGIDPFNDVTITQVAKEACITAMQNGEISGACLPDNYAYDMMQEGIIKPIRSITWDEDFRHEPCCVLAFNGTFVRENPITAKKITECIHRASLWIQENKEEAVQIMLDEGMVTGEYDKFFDLVDDLNFAITDDEVESGMYDIIDDYIRLGLISSSDDPNEVQEAVWYRLLENT